MNENEREYGGTEEERIREMAEKIIGCAYRVSNTLGVGFLEKVYENALAYELRKAGLKVEQQKAIKVYYEGVVVGVYTTDLLVEECVLTELKVAKAFDNIHMAQAINYLTATRLKMCVLLNFGKPRMEFKQVVKNL